jgi:hypothetical protein
MADAPGEPLGSYSRGWGAVGRSEKLAAPLHYLQVLCVEKPFYDKGWNFAPGNTHHNIAIQVGFRCSVL